MFTPNLNNLNTTKNNFKPSKHTAQDSIPSFIRKTYDILEESKFPDIIDWNPEGTAIVIKKPADFCQKVLPLYFKHNNLTSFVRQLNMYNFHKRRTQNIDHVYAHELFQRGKKHLLKEIRRKTHDNNNNTSTNSGQRSPLRLPDSFENAQNPQDMNNIHYENQFLKKLYNDAMSKLAAFEAQINELSNQNRSLWSQLQQQRGQNIAPATAPENFNHNGNVVKTEPFVAQRQESELTLEKLPMTCGGISIPPLKLNVGKENAAPASLNIVKAPSMGINKFFAEESTEANESSFTSPSAQNASENDNIKNEADGYQLAMMKITPQVSQIQNLKTSNDLRINRHDMSIGQLLDAWNVEVQDENGLLGKREPTTGMLELDFTEPALRRHELSIFPKKGLFSSIGNIFGSNNNNDDFDLLSFTN